MILKNAILIHVCIRRVNQHSQFKCKCARMSHGKRIYSEWFVRTKCVFLAELIVGLKTKNSIHWVRMKIHTSHLHLIRHLKGKITNNSVQKSK